MTALSFISPKIFLLKIMDMFQKPVAFSPNTPFKERQAHKQNTTESVDYTTSAPARLNISLTDLKVISTALLQYRRTLAKQGNTNKAEDVAKIDRQLFDIIEMLEGNQVTNQA